MGDKSGIQWTDATLNPIRARHRVTGKVGWICVHKSSGCINCYAEDMNAWRGNGEPFTPSGLKNVELFLDEKILSDPLRWKKPRRIFVCSMTDLFWEQVPDEWIDRLFAVMAQAQHHVFQILTKRPDRMRAYSIAMASLTPLERSLRIARSMYRGHPAEELVVGSLEEGRVGPFPWPLPNVWLGVSCEDQETFDERVEYLGATPAAVRFLSLEPLLGDIDCGNAFDDPPPNSSYGRISWVIIGFESGPHARAGNIAWIRSLVAQCRAAGMAAFVKQLGSKPGFKPAEEMLRGNRMPSWHHIDEASGLHIKAMDDRKGGSPEEWPEDLRVREWPGSGR